MKKSMLPGSSSPSLSHEVDIIPARHGQIALAKNYQGVPAIFGRAENVALRTLEFFAVNVRNANTRKAYARAVTKFSFWCEAMDILDVREVQPLHVAAYIESLRIAPPSIKLHLAALRMLFDWLVVGQVMPTNPASSVRGPRYTVKQGRTPILSAEEVRALIDGINTSTPIGLRDRALIGLMVYTFARVGAVLKMRLEDVYVQNKRTWVRLHEKGGKEHLMPCHHNLEAWLTDYIECLGSREKKRSLFRTVAGRKGHLSDRAMLSADVFRMVRRRAQAADVLTRIGCHSFRATGITEFLRNGGRLEVAQKMANHESSRTTGLYDRRSEPINLDDVERILI